MNFVQEKTESGGKKDRKGFLETTIGEKFVGI